MALLCFVIAVTRCIDRGSHNEPDVESSCSLLVVLCRTTEPQAVLDSPLGVLPSPPPAPLQLEAILEDLRAWYCGIQTERQGISLLSERAKDAEILCGDYGEAEKVAAAYRLGRVGARQLLARALTADEGTARAAAYGLTTAGPSAANAVLPLLSNASNRARRLAAFVVGETAKPEASTIATLGRALRSSDSSKEAQCELLEARCSRTEYWIIGRISVPASDARVYV